MQVKQQSVTGTNEFLKLRTVKETKEDEILEGDKLNLQKSGSAAVYMLRTTQQHHVNLSSLADQKANILIAACSIILSIILTKLSNLELIWGFYVLITTLITTIFLAIIVITPISFQRKRKVPELGNESFNPLFFNHFTEYRYKDYRNYMMRLTGDDEKIREAMIKDIYQLGMVLKKRKYKFLKLSSIVFLTGATCSMLTFLIQFVMEL